MSSVASFALLIPILAIMGFWGFLAFIIYLRHRERMARINAGWPSNPSSSGSADSSWSQGWADGRTWRSHAPIERAIRSIGIGLGVGTGLLTLGFGPWLLGGLIPMLIGLYRFGMMALNLEPAGSSSRPLDAWIKSGLYQGALGLALFLGLLTLGIGPWLIAGTVLMGGALGNIGVWFWFREKPLG